MPKDCVQQHICVFEEVIKVFFSDIFWQKLSNKQPIEKIPNLEVLSTNVLVLKRVQFSKLNKYHTYTQNVWIIECNWTYWKKPKQKTFPQTHSATISGNLDVQKQILLFTADRADGRTVLDHVCIVC